MALETESEQAQTEVSKMRAALSLTPQEQVWLNRKEPIRYVYDPDWAPFEWKNQINRHTGIISDILKLIKRRSGMVLTPVKTETWEQSVELVERGHATMFSAITQNRDRESYLNFTERDIYSYPAVLVTKFTDKAVYLEADHDFEGKRIGIVKSSGLGQYIREHYPDLEYVELDATEGGFQALRSGSIDLFAINTVTAKYYIEKRGFDDLKIALKLDYTYHLKIAVHKGAPLEMISILDKSLASISDEQLNEVFNKWTEIEVVHQTDWNFLFQVSGVMLLLIMALLWSNRRLSHEVDSSVEALSLKDSQLNAALDEIRDLRGIIPICSYCHSICDDDGAWSRLEAYLSSHSAAEFSHGICPKCLPKVQSEAGIDDDSHQG